MSKPFFKSRIVKVYYYPNGSYMAVYRNAIVVGNLHPRYINNRTIKLLLALSVNKPFRSCKGSAKVTITILDDMRYFCLREIARINFPNAHIN